MISTTVLSQTLVNMTSQSIGPGGLCAPPVVTFASVAGHTDFISFFFLHEAGLTNPSPWSISLSFSLHALLFTDFGMLAYF